jgi:hypothetical protein
MLTGRLYCNNVMILGMHAIDSIAIHSIEDDKDISSFYVEVDYIIVVRHHVMSQQLFSSNCRQLGIATDPSVAEATRQPG